MKDMLEALKRAKAKKIFQKNEFVELLQKIQSADSSLQLDWDDGAGEEWARFYHEEKGLICMIHARIGIVFIKSYQDRKIRKAIESLELVPTEGFGLEEWRIDLERFAQSVPEICWHASEGAVDVRKFSLEELYYATV